MAREGYDESVDVLARRQVKQGGGGHEVRPPARDLFNIGAEVGLTEIDADRLIAFSRISSSPGSRASSAQARSRARAIVSSPGS